MAPLGKMASEVNDRQSCRNIRRQLPTPSNFHTFSSIDSITLTTELLHPIAPFVPDPSVQRAHNGFPTMEAYGVSDFFTNPHGYVVTSLEPVSPLYQYSSATFPPSYAASQDEILTKVSAAQLLNPPLSIDSFPDVLDYALPHGKDYLFDDMNIEFIDKCYILPSISSTRCTISDNSDSHTCYEEINDNYNSIADSRCLMIIPEPSQSLPKPPKNSSNEGPPPRHSLTSHFSSEVKGPDVTSRKNKCNLCGKRFTCFSSLQTHIHSHTGAKPFPCLVEGCGRRFSVCSNLRRHRKIHDR